MTRAPPPTLSTRAEGLRVQVLALQEHAEALRTLGVTRGLNRGDRVHGFRMQRPLPEEEIAAFESGAGVTLPEAYRAFLRVVGDGPLGPGYGLFPLRGGDDTTLGGLSVRRLAEPVTPTDDVGREHTGACLDDEEGALRFCHVGCGHTWHLALCGPHRGQVGEEAASGPRWFGDFITWYGAWLDATLEGAATLRALLTPDARAAVPDAPRPERVGALLRELRAALGEPTGRRAAPPASDALAPLREPRALTQRYDALLALAPASVRGLTMDLRDVLGALSVDPRALRWWEGAVMHACAARRDLAVPGGYPGAGQRVRALADPFTPLARLSALGVLPTWPRGVLRLLETHLSTAGR